MSGEPGWLGILVEPLRYPFMVRALLAGRFNLAYEDIDAVALPALRHRVFLNFEGEANGIRPDRIITDILAALEKDKA